MVGNILFFATMVDKTKIQVDNSDENIEVLLTAKVEVDASGDLSILVLGFHFVKSSVRLDDIIEFQNHRVLVPPVLVHADPRPVVLHNCHVLTEPHHVRFRTATLKLSISTGLIALSSLEKKCLGFRRC